VRTPRWFDFLAGLLVAGLACAIHHGLPLFDSQKNPPSLNRKYSDGDRFDLKNWEQQKTNSVKPSLDLTE